MRYRVGFENESIKSTITERNPGYFPIVDSGFGWGAVIAIVDSKQMAERITALLNAAEPMEG